MVKYKMNIKTTTEIKYCGGMNIKSQKTPREITAPPFPRTKLPGDCH
jgi:hypothetical protein